MKYAFAFLATVLFVGTLAVPFKHDDDADTSALDRDFEDFYKLLPADKIAKVVEDHVDDPELWRAVEYLLSDDLHNLIYAVEDLPEFEKYVLYLQAAGYNAIREIRKMHEAYGMKEYVPPKGTNAREMQMAEMKKGGGFDGYYDDLAKILPKEEIKELHERKAKESPAFAKFRAAVYSEKFTAIRTALFAQKAFQNLIHETKAHSCNLLKAYSFQYQLLGFYL